MNKLIIGLVFIFGAITCHAALYNPVAASGANTTLSNLGTTAVNAALLCDGNARNIGAFNNPWGTTYVQGLFMYDGSTKNVEFQVTGQTSPSGAKSSPTMDSSVVGNALTIFTHNATSASNAGDLNLEGGNSSAGIAGNVNVRAGSTSGGGTAGKVIVTGQGLQLVAHGAKPACAVGLRGTIFYVAGAGGALDTLEICRKDAGDAYAWVSLF